MIQKIIKLYYDISFETKAVIGIILLTFVVGVIERYEISKNINNQFLEAKKSRNLLLVNTVSPIIALNMSLGLEESNKEYLDLIKQQNPDVTFIELKDVDNTIIYNNTDNEAVYMHHIEDKEEVEYIDFCDKKIVDSASKSVIGMLHLHFSRKDYYKLQEKNRTLTLKLGIIVVLILILFIKMVKRELRRLKILSTNVLEYNPKMNNFPLSQTTRDDEVGVIQNAIVSMVKNIGTYTKMLDETNATLEQKVKERTTELEIANKKLQKLSYTDSLTELSNKRYFYEFFQRSWDIAKRKGEKISLIMCDIDYFKKVNDTYGHQVGDEVLKIVALALQKSLKRSSDIIARYGGEEFIIMMYDADVQKAIALCEMVQINMKDLQKIESKNLTLQPVTMSFGVTSRIPLKEDKTDLLIKQADDALYKAKESGRNRIVSYKKV